MNHVNFPVAGFEFILFFRGRLIHVPRVPAPARRYRNRYGFTRQHESLDAPDTKQAPDKEVKPRAPGSKIVDDQSEP